MKPLYTDNEFKNSKSTDKLPCKCYQCNNIFYEYKKIIANALRSYHNQQTKYCSQKCHGLSKIRKQKVNCKNCNVEFEKLPNEIKKTKNNFCSRSCAASYNNKHKTHGTRRSKLEMWLEDQLNILYPNLNILFNDKETIKSELDIYIPSMKLGFELNGIFHYEPIYGEDKLQKIQENDFNKFQACQKQNISLCSIDTSGQKYFKPKTSQRYLDIITTIINKERLLNS